MSAFELAATTGLSVAIWAWLVSGHFGRDRERVLKLVRGSRAATAAPTAPWALRRLTWPLVGLRARGRERERRRVLDRELAPAIDVFVLGLEAGLPLETAVSEYCRSSASDLARELAITAGELEVGYRRTEALQRLVERSGSAAVAALVQTIRLADELGTPLAAALRSLAARLRTERRQRLQAAALRAPVTMLLPTAAFILAPIFAIVLGPIAIRLMAGTLI